MLQRKLADAAFGAIWDPIAVRACVEAGLNTTFYLRLGGKCSQASGSPIDVEVTVRGIKEDHEQAGLGNSRVPMGLSVWLKVGGIDVVLSSIRTQIFGPDAFTGLGVEFAGKRIIAVKSTQHFQQHFSRIADRIIHVATPGALQMRFSEIRYRKIRDQNYFPRVPDPLGSGRA
jgi:microcystin degradation protein MlrC